jgi:hypothetical protein
MSTPAWLMNSKRRHEKRTYTPLILPVPQNGNADAVGLASMVRSLMLTDAEQAQLRQRLTSPGAVNALGAMARLSSAVSASGVLAGTNELMRSSRADLQSVASELAHLRQESAQKLTAALSGLDQAYTRAAHRSPETSPGGATPTSSAQAQPGALTAASAAHSPALAQERLAIDANPEPARTAPSRALTPVSLAPTIASLAAARPRATPGTLLQRTLGPTLAARAQTVLDWAAQHRAEALRPALQAAQPYVPTLASEPQSVLLAMSTIARLKLIADLFNEWLTQRDLQPLGLLFLERLEMIPGAIERGELAYSLPLAPREKVTLAHREWAVREEQFSEFIEDVLENYSEQGVAQTDDIALSTSTQTSHSDALSMSQPVASAPGVHVTSPMDTTSAVGMNDTQSQQESRAQSRTVTALASTRTMKDHKISFTVTTVSGMEDFTAHLIENKHADKSVRIDYFKRVRSWQSNLYRYGVRLTYDVVLPDPGERLREREVEIQNIVDELGTEFSLDLVPSDVTILNWENLADLHGVALPPPPDATRNIEVSQTVSFPTPIDVTTGGDGVKYTSHHRVQPLSVTAPANYQLSNLNVHCTIQTWTSIAGYPGWVNVYAGQSVALATANAGGYCTLDWDLGPGQVPTDGQITVFFRMQVAQSGMVRLLATYVPTEAAMEAWRSRCWTIIRDAESARRAQHRSYLRDRLSMLQRDIAADDPVRLRRMEREAIMRTVLEWLFPGFKDASSVLASLPSPGSLDPGRWQQVMQYGEYIKFVQTAIDWDNVMVFLYPYFWDTIWNEPEKLFLQHPDPVHREFLRAGSARVILAIQPGYEQEVVSLLDQGQLGKLPHGTRFQASIDYVAATNADLRPNPNDGDANPGTLIGSWTDYTPSSALDIETTVMPVIEA